MSHEHKTEEDRKMAAKDKPKPVKPSKPAKPAKPSKPSKPTKKMAY